MDYEKYFLQQQPTNFPTYKGVRYQGGYGLGNVFKRFFKWIVPIIKDKAVPVLKDVGKKVGELFEKLKQDYKYKFTDS